MTNPISHIGGFGRYSEWWNEEKPRMEKRIKDLEAKNQNEKEKNQ